MSTFTPKWRGPASPESARTAPDKTAKSPSVGFVSASPSTSGEKVPPSVGFVSASPGQIRECGEGYFCKSPNGDRVRLKVSTIINRCRLYAELLAPRLDLSLVYYRLPYDQGTRALLAAPFVARMADLTRDQAADRLSHIMIELEEAFGGEVPADVLQTFAVGALAGVYAVEWGMLAWDPTHPLLAAADYLEVRCHARWASTPHPTPAGGAT